MATPSTPQPMSKIEEKAAAHRLAVEKVDNLRAQFIAAIGDMNSKRADLRAAVQSSEEGVNSLVTSTIAEALNQSSKQ